jgi:hypothetical protein
MVFSKEKAREEKRQKATSDDMYAQLVHADCPAHHSNNSTLKKISPWNQNPPQ